MSRSVIIFVLGLWWAAPAIADDAPPFSGFDPAAEKARFQGAWVVGKQVFIGGRAWEIRGGNITVAPSLATTSGDKTLTKPEPDQDVSGFDVRAPCQVYMTRTDPNGIVQIDETFAFLDGTLYIGRGSAGVRAKDGQITACMLGDLFTLKDHTCLRWSAPSSKHGWTSKPYDCSLKKDGAKEVLEIAGTGHCNDCGTRKLVRHGDVFIDDELAKRKAEKVTSLAVAKARVGKLEAADRAENERRLEQDLETHYFSGKVALKGKLQTKAVDDVLHAARGEFWLCYVTAVVQQSSRMEGKVDISLTIADDGKVAAAHASGLDDHQARCTEKAAMKLVFPKTAGELAYAVTFKYP